MALLCGALLTHLILGFHKPFLHYNNEFSALAIFLVAGPLFLWQYARGRHLNWHSRSLLFWGVLACLALAVLSTVSSTQPDRASDRLQLYGACALFGLALFLSLRERPRDVAVPLLVVLGVVHAFFLIELLLSMYGLVDTAPRVKRGVSTNYFSHIRHFGYLGFYAAISATALSLIGGRLRWAGYPLGLLALYGLIQFGSRGAFLGWLVFLCLLFAVRRDRWRLALRWGGVALLATLAVAYVDAFHPLPHPKQQSVFTRAAVGEDQLGTTRSRVRIWRQSMEEVARRPWVGHGPDAYVLSRCCPRGTVQPHNALVQFLFEFGMLGTMALVALLVCWAWRPVRVAWRELRDEKAPGEMSVLLMLPVSTLAFSMVDGLLYHAVPLLLFVTCLAMVSAWAWHRELNGRCA